MTTSGRHAWRHWCGSSCVGFVSGATMASQSARYRVLPMNCWTCQVFRPRTDCGCGKSEAAPVARNSRRGFPRNRSTRSRVNITP
eukprot:scaffold4419_cov128-Isochrysis_galbana.AAC.9